MTPVQNPDVPDEPSVPSVPRSEAAEARNADVAELSYEAARNELVGIVERLEGGQVALEESMRLWERGEALAEHCSAWLDGAERRLRRAKAEADDGAPGPAHALPPDPDAPASDGA